MMWQKSLINLLASSDIVYMKYLLTFLLIPWNRVLLEKLISSQLVKKLPAFNGTQRFITAFTSSLSWTPCHHSMARPQVVDGGAASNVEGSWEYIELAVTYSWQGVVLQLGGSDRFWQLLTVKTVFMLKHKHVPLEICTEN